MEFKAGLAMFALWWVMTLTLSGRHGDGNNRFGRPAYALAVGLLTWGLMSMGTVGMLLTAALLIYSLYMFWEVIARPSRRRDFSLISPTAAPPAEPAQDYLAQIEFDYVDARRNESHREVDVDAVDAEYFEGFCHTALATRTFVIGRVRGKILDKETGELLPPKRWAAQMRSDPRNGIVTMDGEWKHDDEDFDDEMVAAPPVILFTGFPKAQRTELEELAELRGMKVVKSVTRNLDYLCAGPTAGPTKIEQAGEVGAGILTLDGFLELDGN
jgi:hypothetical protein